jgi:hypothetical protein
LDDLRGKAKGKVIPEKFYKNQTDPFGFLCAFGGFCYSREVKLKDVFGTIEIMENS